VLQVLEQRQHFFEGPDAEDRRKQRVGGRQLAKVGGKAFVDGALEGEHLEAHLLVEELDQTRLDRAVLGDAVMTLADLHDAPAVEQWLEKLQVGEIVGGAGNLRL
jgi:hypothetical protein